MSATAASLSCPICAHTGVFDSVQSLRDRLIYVSTNKMLCPVCQEEVVGLDKLTIHLFSHVKLLTTMAFQDKQGIAKSPETQKLDKQNIVQQKKTRSSGAKNKATTSASASDPIKYVKIFPKLPVISLNTVPIIDISQASVEERITVNNPVYMPSVKTENTILKTNTTCDVCSLQFVDTNILKMHKCLIHNIDENANQSFTRYQCHICPKNFKMRGSLMVHLRVAHYGFLSGNHSSASKTDKEESQGNDINQIHDEKINFERNDSKQWQCDVCRKCFTTKYFLKKHKRLHTGETPYACSQCNKTFTFQQSYHKHLLYHNDEKPHTCNYCGRAFKELSTLHNHQRIHTGEKPFSCESCGKCFRQRVSYLVHRRIHTGVMPYKCTACEKSFRYKVSQRTHKCPAKPPGVVIRQSGDLVEKLKKKNNDSDKSTIEKFENYVAQYPEVSEANAELVRSGAKLSLEDMESDSFKLISEQFIDNINEENVSSTTCSLESVVGETSNSRNDDILNANIEELIDSIPILDKNVPSPSEILKNLCLSQEENYPGTMLEQQCEKSYDLYNDFQDFL